MVSVVPTPTVDQLAQDAAKIKKMAKKLAKLETKQQLKQETVPAQDSALQATPAAAQPTADATMTPAAASTDDAEAKRLRKEAKKQKKRKAEEMLNETPSASAAASASASEPIAAPVKSENMTEDDASAARRAKKAAKKESKRSAQAAADQAPPESSAPEQKPVKASHSHKHSAAPVSHASSSKNGALVKDFYQEHASVKSMTQEEVDAHRAALGITISEPHFRPLTRFDQAGFSSELLQCCAEFKQPSPIQSQCWPVVLSGRDCVAIAETGKSNAPIKPPMTRNANASCDQGAITLHRSLLC